MQHPNFGNANETYLAIIIAHQQMQGGTPEGSTDDGATDSLVHTALLECLEQLTPEQRRLVWNELPGVDPVDLPNDQMTAPVFAPGDRVRIRATGTTRIIERNLGDKFCPPILMTDGAMYFPEELEKL